MDRSKWFLFSFFSVLFQSSFDLLMIGFHFVAMVTSLIWPFLFSNSATFATDRISFIGDRAYNTNWIDYPPKLQKYFILIIARSQENVHFTGLNMFRCTLEVFGKVTFTLTFVIFLNVIFVVHILNRYFQLLKTSCTYYMVFRSFSQR